MILQSMDKISSLPDPILCHILSFLETKLYVSTSVLARRWRFLWTYVRNLHFDKEEYGSHSEAKLGFSDMVYRVMLLHNGPIDSLSFISDGDISRCQIDVWVSTAIARNVQVLYLSNVWLPPCCFKCKTLVELTIQYCTISAESGAVCLPRLKKLHLYSNCYENDESLPNLVSGCSAIEALEIEREVCECDDMDCCYVCSPTLKSLILEFDISCDKLDHEHKLVLDTPAVQYLKMRDYFSQIIGAEKLSSLVVADIGFYNDFELNISRWRDMYQFVKNLSNTKSLTFSSPATAKLMNPTFSFATTRFHNLTKLEVAVGWHFLTEFLECAYNLESLTIREGKDKVKCWREPRHLPKCLLSSLKYVSIFAFAGGEHQLNLVRYILRHAKLLERMKIYSVSRGNDAYSELKMLKQISDFPRGSQTCGLTFV